MIKDRCTAVIHLCFIRVVSTRRIFHRAHLHLLLFIVVPPSKTKIAYTLVLILVLIRSKVKGHGLQQSKQHWEGKKTHLEVFSLLALMLVACTIQCDIPQWSTGTPACSHMKSPCLLLKVYLLLALHSVDDWTSSSVGRNQPSLSSSTIVRKDVHHRQRYETLSEQHIRLLWNQQHFKILNNLVSGFIQGTPAGLKRRSDGYDPYADHRVAELFFPFGANESEIVTLNNSFTYRRKMLPRQRNEHLLSHLLIISVDAGGWIE